MDKFKINMVFAFIFSIIYGFLEYSWLQYAISTGPRVLFIFSQYHFWMLGIFVWVSMAYLMRGVLNVPMMLLIEDVFYSVARWEWASPGAWVDWPFQGFYFIGVYIPGGYIVLIILAMVAYGHKWLIKKIKLYLRG